MKKIKRFFTFCFVIILFVAGFEVKLGYDKYSEALLKKSLDSAILDITSKKNFTPYDEIPEIYFKAVVATEDKRFYFHNGFDCIGTFRAIIRDVKEKELLEGGSTITQQLAKNMYFQGDRTLTRKIAEIFMAVQIEKKLEKKEILELYVNGIYYGSGYYCIYDASMGYFKKKPKNMTDDECTLLAGIPNAPSIYSPKNNPKLAKKRQEKVIECMKECGFY